MNVASEEQRFGAIVIGASAGGVEALSHLMPALQRDIAPPVLIVMHVRQGQPSLLPTLFAERCALKVVEPFDKDVIARGTAYFGPPGYHMMVEAENGASPAIALSVDPPVRFSRPSVDVLFESAAHAYGEHLLGIVLSGANDDGARGARDLRCRRRVLGAGPAHGGRVIDAARGHRRMRAARSADAGRHGDAAGPLHRPQRIRQARSHLMTQPIHVLIVDDIRNNITALEASLARPDLSVLKAESGPAALELLLKHEIALAILDVNMPGMDGFELAELMRGSPRTAHVPIIFLTATAQDANRTFRGYEAGAVDFLYKPFDSRILNSKVDVFIHMERQKQQLATQLATVQQLLDANEMLMAVLGHDLRTPLSAVIASAEYLSRFVKDENVANIGGRIKSSGMRMVRMVDQLLNLARLRGGRVVLQPRAVDLMTLAKNIVEEYEARVGKGRMFILPQGDTLLHGDGDLLSQVFSNLIGNALQHGLEGSAIQVRLEGRVDDVVIVVQNAGEIPADVLPTIFAPYRSGRRPSESSGLGLGLYITREIAQMHGGDVSAHSTAGAGTLFEVTLPRVPHPRAGEHADMAQPFRLS
ncbi:Protein-glutamate methylesterase [Candidatus Burkholderia verschuerenii]|uniref:histidine kinase n=2 Tax=Candidatus Burkholderia verschuerenii TaxID=242163 RepID=A0A0L0MK36_9BURK|nr:Protein-glutamate methylesterase [Candidatus Burkholderia verschuerenii]